MNTCDFCGAPSKYEDRLAGERHDFCGSCHQTLTTLQAKYNKMLEEEFLELANKEIKEKGIEIRLFNKGFKFRLKED